MSPSPKANESYKIKGARALSCTCMLIISAFFVLMEGILSVKLSTDITVHKVFILIIFQPTISLQPLWQEFPFFLFTIVIGSNGTFDGLEALPATKSLSGSSSFEAV